MTIDTNVLDRDFERVKQVCEGRVVEIRATTVTLREQGLPVPNPDAIPETAVYDESAYDSGAVYADVAAVPETFVLDESRLDEGVLGDDDAPQRFEAILSIISNKSFPPAGPSRAVLTAGQRRQLRDAMILEAHARERRDVLVSNDRTAFVGKDGEKRPRLEALCSTRILTVDEFCDAVAKGLM